MKSKKLKKHIRRALAKSVTKQNGCGMNTASDRLSFQQGDMP